MIGFFEYGYVVVVYLVYFGQDVGWCFLVYGFFDEMVEIYVLEMVGVGGQDEMQVIGVGIVVGVVVIGWIGVDVEERIVFFFWQQQDVFDQIYVFVVVVFVQMGDQQ